MKYCEREWERVLARREERKRGAVRKVIKMRMKEKEKVIEETEKNKVDKECM